MSTTTVHKFKWFWAWADDKEEAWLGEMSRQGFHLQHPGLFGFYTFEQGAKRAYAYRLDYVMNSRKMDDYFLLFRDAGWEHVGAMSGWQYWRKPVHEGETAEIFTDAESKIAKYRRLIVWLAILLAANSVNLVNFAGVRDRYQHILIHALYAFLFVITGLMIYGVIKLALRIHQLKRV